MRVKRSGRQSVNLNRAAKVAPKYTAVVMYKPLTNAPIASRRRFARLMRAVKVARSIH